MGILSATPASRTRNSARSDPVSRRRYEIILTSCAMTIAVTSLRLDARPNSISCNPHNIRQDSATRAPRHSQHHRGSNRKWRQTTNALQLSKMYRIPTAPIQFESCGGHVPGWHDDWASKAPWSLLVKFDDDERPKHMGMLFVS
ncbi:hypothetical protein BD410DRAFT_789230 [Rickenella mellea]|uniref:Uncharacterized protein n=1 Tax=Rickenella mellea TaxID=50990 RepID=A0A4Y7Q4T9_9AGAM|nr:hypothetical protein BD410DRAFT_789230 [Rickenella mellea]